jgi:hypothetical protein
MDSTIYHPRSARHARHILNTALLVSIPHFAQIAERMLFSILFMSDVCAMDIGSRAAAQEYPTVQKSTPKMEYALVAGETSVLHWTSEAATAK